MLAWTKQNTMQSAMRTVLEWPQSHATSKTINMITNEHEPQQKCRLGTVSKNYWRALTVFTGTQPRARLLSWFKTYSCSVRMKVFITHQNIALTEKENIILFYVNLGTIKTNYSLIFPMTTYPKILCVPVMRLKQGITIYWNVHNT